MLVIKKTTCPYIASRNNESTDYSVVFEGTKNECEQYLLDIVNENFDCQYFESIRKALTFFRKKNTHDGIWKLKRINLSYDSREWHICTKKEFKEIQEIQ
jgi:hypothetical protein